MAFSPDSLLLFAEQGDGEVALWDIPDSAVGQRVTTTALGREQGWERGRLQEADTVDGPWRDRWDASDPLPLIGVAAHKFYRVILW